MTKQAEAKTLREHAYDLRRIEKTERGRAKQLMAELRNAEDRAARARAGLEALVGHHVRKGGGRRGR